MDLESLKILICDDSILTRNRVRDIVQSLGYTSILEAKDGQEAVDLYKQERPAIVFLDIVMPVKDGIATLIEIREFDKNAKVVMISSAGSQQNLTKAIREGAIDFIPKIMETEGIRTVMERLLNAVMGGGQ